MQITRARHACWSLVWATLLLVVTGCATNPPPPTNGGGGGSTTGGPQFVINSPASGSSVSGPVFFSVQPFTPGDVKRVAFEAGGVELVPQYPGEDAFRVFLIPRDFDDGPLTLTARVEGHDGRSSEASIVVHVVANPPSQATVTRDGAILGTVEANGAMSVLNIPGGVAEGATVRFEARTQDEVRQATGVDYEALGVTFLGAQEIASDRPIDRTLMVSSGGFGPMVQPGQAVVNYSIMPDGDGNGVGELVVVNTASVAPNGDVVSDPIPMIQTGANAATADSRGVRRSTTNNVSAAPGALIEIETSGLNPFAEFGSVAIFAARSAGLYAPAIARVTPTANGAQVATVAVPALPPGPATVAFVNLSNGSVGPDIPITIETLPPLQSTAEAVFLTLIDRMAEEMADVPGASSSLSEMRAAIVELFDVGPSRDVLDLLEHAARMIEHAPLGANARAALAATILTACAPPYYEWTSLLLTMAAASNPVAGLTVAAGLFAYSLYDSSRLDVVDTPLTLASGAIETGRAIATLEHEVRTLNRFSSALTRMNMLAGMYSAAQAMSAYVDCLYFPPPNTTPGGGTTGMGSAPPPGGPGAGSVFAAAADGAVQGLRRADVDAPTTLAGRFVVKVFSGSTVMPFTGVTDASGYFFVPFIPEHQPFTAVATDAVTGEVRSFEGVGAPTGGAVALYFDFMTDEAENGVRRVTLDSMHARTIEPGASHVYAFEAAVGQVARFALHTDIANPWPTPLVGMSVTSPSGALFGTTANQSQYAHLHTIWPKAIEENGQHILVVANTTGSVVAYTLGLVEVPTPVPVASSADGVRITGDIAVLHDVHRYGFPTEAFSAGKVLLTYPATSDLETLVTLERPNGGRQTLNPSSGAGTRSIVLGPFALLAQGQHVLDIEASLGPPTLDTALGTYDAMLFVPPVAPLPLHTNVSGQLDMRRLATYRFDPAEAELVTIAVLARRSANGWGMAGNLMLMNLGGGFFTRRIEGDELMYADLGLVTTAEQRIVVVDGWDDAGFDYQLAVSPVAPISEARPLDGARPRLEASGSIDVIGEIVSYAFQATEGEEITITLQHPDAAELRSRVAVYRDGPGTVRGSFVGQFSTTATARSATFTFTVPVAGTYLLDVSSSGGNIESVDHVLGPFDLVLEVE